MTDYITQDYTRKRIYIDKKSLDGMSEPLSTYTAKLEAKIKNQAAELKRLLAENAGLKEQVKKLVAGFKETDKKICEACEHIDSVDKARAEGQNEAWELVRKLYDMDIDDKIQEAFNLEYSFAESVIKRNTYSEATAKVEAWEKAKSKPQKTMMQDFFEKFPNASIYKDTGLPMLCPFRLGYCKEPTEDECGVTKCVDCWNRPLEQIGGEGDETED